jgi:hypothetical protein
MLGIHAFGTSRTFPYAAVLKEKLIQDRIGSEPIVLVVGGDNRSVRAFRRRIRGISETPEFYRIADNGNSPGSDQTKAAGLMMDAPIGSRWNFQGCAIAGKLKGMCLDHIDAIKDYWFHWRNYNPETTVYGVKQKIH